MLEIKINVDAPEVANAINNLANALSVHTPVSIPQTAEPKIASAKDTAAPVMADKPAPKDTAVAPAEVAPTPVQGAGATPENVQPTKQITLDDLSNAGSALLDLGKMPQLMELLKKYGVQAITQLSPDKYGAFAVELNALGANL